MRYNLRKIACLSLVACMCAGAVTFSSCGKDYSPKHLTGVETSVKAESNGGFLVKKGDYYYFINGEESYTANNTTGKVKKGALYRISSANLQAGNYGDSELVVPVLFVSQNYDAGIYIYGDYVYFASPTSERELNGNVSNSYISFKRAKLDGSSTEKELSKYFFRSSNNGISYRYVEVDGVVYCMYVENKVLYSYNTATNKKTMLVSGAESDYFFDTTSSENPVAYYTMKVPYDKDYTNKFDYNQLYCVSADATTTVDSSNYTYTAGEKTYSFDGAYLKDNYSGFKASDYTTYPYVNLGTLVLDGKGSSTENTQYNDDIDTSSVALSPNGYTYTISSYRDGGFYFTRADVNTSSSQGENTSLYYVSDSKTKESGWTSVQDNTTLLNYRIALDTNNASASAVFFIDNDKHYYIYTSGDKIYKGYTDDHGVEETFAIVNSAASMTLWKIEGDFLYYYGSGANGKYLYRVDMTGASAYDYSSLGDEKYQSLQILDVDFNDSWYKPELLDGYLFYSDEISFASTSYDYISVVNLSDKMTYDTLKEFNDKYTEVKDYISNFSEEGYNELNKTLNYYFRTGETKVFEDFLTEAKAQGYKDNYRYSDYEIEEFRAFAAHTDLTANGGEDYSTMFKDANGKYYDTRDYFVNMIGEMKSSDVESIEKVWTSNSYIEDLPEITKEGLSKKEKTWIIVGSCAGALVIVAAVVVIIVVKKKKKAKAELEITQAYKKKIDTTDDKTIDVYNVEEESNNEGTEEVSEEKNNSEVDENGK